MKIIRKIIKLVMLPGLILLVSYCDKLSRTGVCTGYSSEFNSTYCKDGWTQDECDEWNDIQVNGVDWYFYPGQTCEERGTPATQ